MSIDCGRCLAARATHAPHRANLRCLGLSVGIAIALAGCTEDPLTDPPERGILRIRLFQQCVKDATGFTPTTVADRGSWSEVVDKCESAAFYQTNTCAPHFQECLDVLPASGTSGSAQDAQRLDPKGAGPVPKADAQ